MNQKLKIFLLCPIPDDQKPINQYIELKENFFIQWSLFSNQKYFKQIGFFFILSFLLTALFQIPSKNEMVTKEIIEHSFFYFHQFIELGLKTILFLCFFFVSLISIWFELNQKLKKAFLFYEEASWFDGQIWQKPFFLIKNDRLLSKQKVEPILQRLFQTLILLFFFFSIFFVLFEIF